MRDSRPLGFAPETVGVATGQRAAVEVSAQLQRTGHPGVYRRGSRFVAVYRRGGRQRKESAASFAEARALKLARDAEEPFGYAEASLRLAAESSPLARPALIA